MKHTSPVGQETHASGETGNTQDPVGHEIHRIRWDNETHRIRWDNETHRDPVGLEAHRDPVGLETHKQISS